MTRRRPLAAVAAVVLGAIGLGACGTGPSPPVAADLGAVVVTAGGEALVDGATDVPPTLDLRITAARRLRGDEVAVRLDGRPLPVHSSADGGLVARVDPLPLGSAHRLELSVAGRAARSMGVQIVPPAAALAALHRDAGSGATVLDLAFALAPHPRAVEAAIPGGERSWIDARHLRVVWPTAPGGDLRLPASLPTDRGSHLAGDLDLALAPVPPQSVRLAVVPVVPALSRPPLVVAFSVPTAASRASVAAHLRQLSLLSPTGIEATADGSVVGAPDAAAVAAARAAGVPVWPLIQNQGFDPGAVHRLLSDPQATDRLVAELRRVAAEPGFGGVHLDFEGIPAGDRAAFATVVRRVAAGLHGDGHGLAVDVVPRIPGHVGLAAQAYDLAAIGSAADWVVLMAYEEHGPTTAPGPVAGIDWVESAVAAALGSLRPNHTLLGIAGYARSWSAQDAEATSEAGAVAEAVAAPGARFDLDPGAMTVFVHLPDGGTIALQDAGLLLRTARLAEDRGLAGIALWRLGFEDPAFWAGLPAVARPLAPPG